MSKVRPQERGSVVVNVMISGVQISQSQGRSHKKVAVLLDFVQITSTPPPFPLIWSTCTTFLKANVAKKIWAGVSPSLPIPKLTQYIQFVKSGQKIWAGPSPLIWTKSKRTATFFSGNHPSLTEHDFYRKSLDILEAWRILQRIKGSLPQLLQWPKMSMPLLV